jgi:Protein of unknown function (DUF3618).
MGETSNQDLIGRSGVRRSDTLDDLKADIEQTRDNIGQTLEAIGEKLSPRHMVQEAAGSVKDAAASVKDAAARKVGNAMASASERVGNAMATASERAGELMDSTRDAAEIVRDRVAGNPWPVALLAVGVGWYAYQRLRRTNGHDDEEGYSPRWYEEGEEMPVPNTRHSFAAEITHQVSRFSSRATSDLSRIFRQNPLAFGVAAAAIGVAIGLSVPETQTENRLLGETRDAMVNKAREAVSQTGV